MSKQVLDMGAVSESFFSDTAMIGIGSYEPGYRFCWALNNAFGFNFVREPESDVEYKPARDQVHFFSLYQYTVPFSTCIHHLYQLRSEKKALLPEIKQLDYLWLITSESAEHEAHIITAELRNMPVVQLAQVIHSDMLKNLDHLLL